MKNQSQRPLRVALDNRLQSQDWRSDRTWFHDTVHKQIYTALGNRALYSALQRP